VSDYASAPGAASPGTLLDLFFDRIDRGGPTPLYQNFDGDADRQVAFGVDETVEVVVEVAAAIRDLGLQPGDRAAILSENRTEWALADWACILAHVADVPIYDTLPADQAAFILGDAGVGLVFASSVEQGRKALQALEVAGLAGVPVVVFDGDGGVEGLTSWESFRARGRATGETLAGFRERADALSPDALVTLIYTSGTTGVPKGVMLTHANLHSNVLSAGQVLEIAPGDVSMSFLPLSHVFQRMVDYLLFWRGCTLARAHDILTVADDFKLVSPTIEVSVPRLYEKVYNKVTDASGVKAKLVGWALGVGRRWADATLEGRPVSAGLALQYRLADRLVFSKIRAAVGGRMRFFVSGGAPLAPELARFFFAAGLPILEGYGLTETSPVTNVNPPEGIRIGTVGPPIPGTEIRIAEDGEILVRGPQVMKGYYNQPDATAEVIDADGWFHTGDIGSLDPDGYLRITDRKKDIIVTAGGKNVAPQPIENRLKTHPLVEQLVMVGDRRKFCALLIVPAFEVLERWASERGIEASGRDGLVADARVREEFGKILHGLGDLARYEQPKKIGLLTREFTIEEGTLTPTQKVKRRAVQDRYGAEIDRLYDVAHEKDEVVVLEEPS
jgi:long-chain acyl-CoA synthetase